MQNFVHLFRRKKSVFAAIVVGQAMIRLVAADAELTNFKTGIDATWAGTKGVDYMEEYFYSDKLVSDRKVVYIKASTAINLSHNARNVARVTSKYYDPIGINGVDGIPNSGDEGKIRYKVDGDMSWGPQWTDRGAGAAAHPAYTGPLSFATLKYPDGKTVLGRTGNNGEPVTSKSRHFNYGVLDSFGDQWHTIQVADDDWFSTTDTEWRASDGKVLHFVVNPKTPALTVRATGNGQFYTTPPKTYFIPKIHEQTTYFNAGSGTVTFELKDINGNDVHYRVNGGAWSTGANPVLTASSFTNGANSLEYYYTGNEAYTKKRIVVKNPTFPSANESHGFLVSGNTNNYAAMLERRKIAPYKYHWDRLVSGASDSGKRTEWDSNSGKGLRYVPQAAFPNALVAKINGVTAAPSGKSKSFAQYAKEMILQNARTIDSVGFELDFPQNTGPTRELFYRGYYDVTTTLDLAQAYDLLISIYRSDQHANGITPIEDYYIRDSIASDIVECLMFMNRLQGSTVDNDTGGMWDTARKCGAVVGMFALPSYSTAYYGTCGLDGNAQVYTYTPFPDTPLTWKQAFLDGNQPIKGYPNLAQRGIGIDEYLCTADGNFVDRVAYVANCGGIFLHVANTLKYHYPSKTLPHMEAFFLKATNGSIMGLKDNSGPSKNIFLSVFNANFPRIATVGLPFVTSLTTLLADRDDQQINGYMPHALSWYDSEYTGSTTTTQLPAPSNARTSTVAP